MYKVVKYFTDLQDNSHAYNVGDIFPRNGLEVSEQRFKELSTTQNKRKTILIKEVEEKLTEKVNEMTEEVNEVTEEVNEPKEDFMNPPVVELADAVEEEPPKKKRGRPRNAQ